MGFFGKNTLYSLKIFSGIQQEVVDSIVKGSEKKSFGEGEEILRQGENSDGRGYIIESGSVKIIRDNEEKKILRQGEIFGEFSLLSEEARSATVIANENTNCIIVSQEMLFEMIQHDNNSINKEIMSRMEENLEDTGEEV